MAGYATIKGYQVIGSIIRRDGVHHALFGQPFKRFCEAMEAVSRLEYQLGTCWAFNVRGIRETDPADILKDYKVRPSDPRPCKVYAVETAPLTETGLGDLAWFKVWARSEAEAKTSFSRSSRERRKLCVLDVVELTLQQETELESLKLDPAELSDQLEEYTIQNSLRRFSCGK